MTVRWLGGRPARLRARLPFDWRASCAAPPFSFGAPFPWEELDLAGTEFGSGKPPILGLIAPRSDGRQASLLFWFQDDGPNVATADLGPLIRDLESSRRVRHVRTRSVSLSGGHCKILALEGPDQIVHNLVVNHGNGVLSGELLVPATSAAGYLTHFETMLATWDWVAS